MPPQNEAAVSDRVHMIQSEKENQAPLAAVAAEGHVKDGAGEATSRLARVEKRAEEIRCELQYLKERLNYRQTAPSPRSDVDHEKEVRDLRHDVESCFKVMGEKEMQLKKIRRSTKSRLSSSNAGKLEEIDRELQQLKPKSIDLLSRALKLPYPSNSSNSSRETSERSTSPVPMLPEIPPPGQDDDIDVNVTALLSVAAATVQSSPVRAGGNTNSSPVSTYRSNNNSSPLSTYRSSGRSTVRSTGTVEETGSKELPRRSRGFWGGITESLKKVFECGSEDPELRNSSSNARDHAHAYSQSQSHQPQSQAQTQRRALREKER